MPVFLILFDIVMWDAIALIGGATAQQCINAEYIEKVSLCLLLCEVFTFSIIVELEKHSQIQ